MNFDEALIALRAGKRVRRPHWVPDSSMGIGDYMGQRAQRALLQFNSTGHPIWAVFLEEDLLATDWQVVDEPDFRPSREDLAKARDRILADRLADLARRVEALEKARPSLPSPDNPADVEWMAERLYASSVTPELIGTPWADWKTIRYDDYRASVRAQAKRLLRLMSDWRGGAA